MEEINNSAGQELLRNDLVKEETVELSSEVLLFVINDRLYGVESSFVTEVFESRKITPIPLIPEYVIGIINHRGEIIPVIDYKTFVESTVKTGRDNDSIVVLNSGKVKVGLLVNNVTGIKRLKWQPVKYECFGINISEIKYLHGITSENFLIIDANKILTDDKLNIQDKI